MASQLASKEIVQAQRPISRGDSVRVERVRPVEDRVTRQLRPIREVLYGIVDRVPGAPEGQTELRIGNSALRGGSRTYLLSKAVIHEQDGAMVQEPLSAHVITPEAQPFPLNADFVAGRTVTIERAPYPDLKADTSQLEQLPLQ